MKIKELMTKSVLSISPEASIQEAACKMNDLDVSSLAVIENGQLCGIITDRNICCRCVADDLDAFETEVAEIMSLDVSSCFSDQDITVAADIMEEMQIRRVAIRNLDNSIAGLLSVDDLARGSHNLAGEVLEATNALC